MTVRKLAQLVTLIFFLPAVAMAIEEPEYSVIDS